MKKNIVFILFISFWLHAAEQRAPALASSASQAATATDILAQLNGNSPEAQEQIIALKKVFGHVAHRHRTELTPFKKLSIPQTIQESHAEDDPSADDEKNQGALQDYASYSDSDEDIGEWANAGCVVNSFLLSTVSQKLSNQSHNSACETSQKTKSHSFSLAKPQAASSDNMQ